MFLICSKNIYPLQRKLKINLSYFQSKGKFRLVFHISLLLVFFEIEFYFVKCFFPFAERFRDKEGEKNEEGAAPKFMDFTSTYSKKLF